MTDTDDSERTTRRRRDVLRALGTSGAVSGLFGAAVGSGSARPGRGRGRGDRGGGGPDGRGVGPCTCESACPDGTFCGKVDGVPEQGETYTFSEDGERYSVTVETVETVEGEEKGFSFSSSDDIERVCIKGGPEVASYEADGSKVYYAPNNPNSGKRYQISNFSFCGSGSEGGSTYYQIDLIEGDVICGEDLSMNNRYHGRLLAVLAVNGETGDHTQSNTNPNNDSCDCLDLSSQPISYESSTRTATVDFADIADGVPSDQRHALAAYEILDPDATTFAEDEADGPIEQRLVACDVVDGEEKDTLTVDLDDGGCEVC
ncbi:hypothetical protein [Haloarcula litorea]|uniref:hypothetical protein n=1 Tax=Haloarcula litorea TaxID=3032579 RepID=UPI0023E825FE|nr:hypothetical protein [Halomicroarcula sp. GDY20]